MRFPNDREATIRRTLAVFLAIFSYRAAFGGTFLAGVALISEQDTSVHVTRYSYSLLNLFLGIKFTQLVRNLEIRCLHHLLCPVPIAL